MQKPEIQEFDFEDGIVVKRPALQDMTAYQAATVAQRHGQDYHFFIVIEKGSMEFELDFEKYQIKQHAIVYVGPGQVHRLLTGRQMRFYVIALKSENIHAKYLSLLHQVKPSKPMVLMQDRMSSIVKSAELSFELFQHNNSKLQASMLKDSCNTLVGLVLSEYLEGSRSTGNYASAQVITRSFNSKLEHNFASMKQPALYARAMGISVPYLNQCIKNTTGFTVSHHIQHRVILEAKRQLFSSDRTIKEIARELGYEDYAYFSRFFSTITGMTPTAFRNKNFD